MVANKQGTIYHHFNHPRVSETAQSCQIGCGASGDQSMQEQQLESREGT